MEYMQISLNEKVNVRVKDGVLNFFFLYALFVYKKNECIIKKYKGMGSLLKNAWMDPKTSLNRGKSV